MKKNFAIVMALVAGFAVSSCKSSESAYKKAYEKAQAAQNQDNQYANTQYTQQTQPVQVTSVQPVQQTQPVQQSAQDYYNNVSVRNEAVTLVDGAGLQDYCVVVGSFGMLANAKSLQQTLKNKGFAAQVAQANVNGKAFYRVIATTHTTKMDAAQSRARLTNDYPDAWLLYKK
ncbi:MAG: SPOR domain-containing protein [Bacteroidaceae bacterium]|nr:SPOR domain-containing protein [Prevotellaceae bacterium]MDY5631104.1 SPOR domain-containing protein [Bacteroidaceae bacterium]